jgi:hypothetical protein
LVSILIIQKKEKESSTSFFQKGDAMSSKEIKVLFLFIIVIIDALGTVYLISGGLIGESNPMLNWILQKTDVTFMAMFKIVMTLLLLISILKSKYLELHMNWAIPTYIIILFGSVATQFI